MSRLARTWRSCTLLNPMAYATSSVGYAGPPHWFSPRISSWRSSASSSTSTNFGDSSTPPSVDLVAQRLPGAMGHLRRPQHRHGARPASLVLAGSACQFLLVADEPMPDTLLAALADLGPDELSEGLRKWNAVEEQSRRALTECASTAEGPSRLADAGSTGRTEQPCLRSISSRKS